MDDEDLVMGAGVSDAVPTGAKRARARAVPSFTTPPEARARLR